MGSFQFSVSVVSFQLLFTVHCSLNTRPKNQKVSENEHLVSENGHF